MKKMLKFVLTMLLTCCIIIGMFQTKSNAWDDYENKMNGLINATYEDNTNVGTKVNSVTGTIITSVRIIGVCVAIVMLLVVAMKYMTAAPGEKADIKKSAIQYVVGAIVLFGATGLLGLISNFATVF